MKFLIALLVAVAPIVANAADKRSEGLQALQDPERLVSIGNHARASGDPMLALSFYDRALQVDPGNLPALRAATETALSQNWPQSLGLAERWVSREPRNALAHLAVGSGLLIQNRPTEAMQALSMSEAAGGPKSAIALQCGMALDLLGQPRDAQISYAAALQNAPDDLTVL